MKTLREIQGRANTIRNVKWRLFQVGWFMFMALIVLVCVAAVIAMIYGLAWIICTAIIDAFWW